MKQKKYNVINKLNAIGLFNILRELEHDYQWYNNYVNRYYTITTNGGESILWKVHEKTSTIYTVSTSCLRFIQTTGWQKSIPVYGHYVLTEKGLRWLKDLITELLI